MGEKRIRPMIFFVDPASDEILRFCEPQAN